MQKYPPWLGLAIIIVIAGVIASYKGLAPSSRNYQPDAAPNSSSTPAVASSTPAAATTSPKTTRAAVKKLDYGTAISTYPYRFQFSECHGLPGQLAVKKNSPVMFDNRDNKSHVIKFGSQSVTVKAYNYEIVYPKVIGVITVTCDGGGAAVLNVQN